MKQLHRSLFLFLLILSTSSFSQSKKYQGLLWEISGNGLTESSYLYGTMHVSNKLAFNVSDAFYNCLGEVDAIGLESAPDNWMEDYRDMGSFNPRDFGFGGNFYQDAFSVQKPGTPEIFTLLENQNSMMNQILYRYNPGNQDYEENTFLDMFIFQAGAKNNKPVYSLEDLEDVIELSIRAMTPDKEDKKENDNNSYLEKDGGMKFVELEEAYRRGDLDKIDSLSKSSTPTKVYHHYFIVERNKNIVNRMDSLMKIHSMFTGIGAAHLPGDEGAIELLRQKGYTVEPVSAKSTGKSHKMRKKFAQQYKSISFSPAESMDQFMTVPTPGELFEMPTGQRGRLEYFCPEPVNGGYFSAIRLFTFGPIYNRGPEYYQATFDSLLYISTPGELIKKEEFTKSSYSGYRILTKTSKNALVEYNVFFTPTEVIIFKGSGSGNYIERTEPQRFFNNIRLQEPASEWSDVSPRFSGAKWKMKGLVTYQDMIKGLDDTKVNPLYQSYDNSNGDYYMVQRYTYNDLNYIEEDSFDLAYLGESFAENLGYEVEVSTETKRDNKLIIEQFLTAKEESSGMKKNLRTKITAKGGTYYLMLSTAEEENTRTFFDSFQFSDFELNATYEEKVDSSLSYRVQTIKPQIEYDFTAIAYSLYKGAYNEEENTDYLSDSKNSSHSLPRTNEEVYVGYSKFHDYAAAESKEAFWDYQIEQIDEEESFIVSRRTMGEKNGDETMTFLFSDSNSTRGIWTKFHLHGGVLYTLQSLIDTVDGPSDHVQTFYDSFEPLDTIIGRDVFEDKADLFHKHAMGTDSLNRINAMKSIEEITFEEDDVQKIVDVYKNYEFDEESERLDRENLIMSLGNVESQEAYDFLASTFEENTFNSVIQFNVLKSYSYTETQEAYDAIKYYLMENTPITDQTRKLNFFNNLYDSLELAKNYFPDLLEVGQSLPEYKPYLVELLAWGYIKDVFGTDNFLKESSMIKRDAMIELKRAVADLESTKPNKSNSYYGRGSLYSSYHSILLDYYALMVGLKKEGIDGTETFFKGLERMDKPKFIVEQQIINHLLKEEVDTVALNEVIKDIDYRVWTYNRLDDNDMLEFFPDWMSQEEMARGYLYYENYEAQEDSIAFLSKQYVNNGVDTGYVYFFKRKNDKNQYWELDYCGVQPKDEKKFETYYQSTKRGLAYKNEKELQETIDKTMEIFQYEYRKRVELSTGYDWGALDGLFGY